MPQIQKTKPVTAVQSSSNGSILGSAVSVASLEDLYVKMVLYGRNRIGKTTLACQFPKPLLLIAIEPSATGGAKSVRKIPGIDVIRITNEPDQSNPKAPYGSVKAVMLAEELKHSNHKYKTVVVDTATSYQDIILQELMGLSKIPEMLSWGMVSEDQYRDRSSKTREALRPFIDLKCHVVITAQEKDHNPPKDRGESKLTRGLQTESFFAADLGGATVKWLQDSCDYIAQLFQDKEYKEIVSKVKVGNEYNEVRNTIETGRIVRRLRTMYHPNFSAGFRSEDPSVVPEYIEAESPQEMYQEMMKVISGIKTAKGKYQKV